MAVSAHSRRNALAGNRWALLSVLFTVRTSIAYEFQSVPAIGPYLVDNLALDFSILGALIGSFMLPGVFLALPSGMLDERFGSKRVLLLGLVGMFFGGLIMLGGSPVQLFSGRLLSGAGAVVLNVVLARIVAERFPPEELVAVMGGFVASWPLGIALALLSLPQVAERFGPIAALLVGASPSAICLITVLVLYTDGRGQVAGQVGARRIIGWRASFLALTSGLVWGFYNVAFVLVVANLPEFLTLRSYSLPAASAITSVFGWVLIITLPGSGLLTQRIGRPIATIVISLLLVLLSVVLLVSTAAVLWWVGMLAVIIGVPAGLIMALPAQALDPDDRSIGMGLFFTTFYLCMAVLPGVAGIVREGTGSPASAIVCSGGAAILAIGALMLFVLLRTHQARAVQLAKSVSLVD